MNDRELGAEITRMMSLVQSGDPDKEEMRLRHFCRFWEAPEDPDEIQQARNRALDRQLEVGRIARKVLRVFARDLMNAPILATCLAADPDKP